jgi:hypothetical protein
MGFQFYALDTLPNVFDVVWCKWPQREDKMRPGKVARPVLVIDVEHREHEDGFTFGSLIVQYGGDYEPHHIEGNLLLTMKEARAINLHKSMVFRLDLGNRKRLPWCKDYFVNQGYVVNQPVIAGSLSQSQCEHVKSCFRKRNLEFPVPK